MQLIQYSKPTSFPLLLPCAQCGESIIAPVWSEHVSDRCVRHLWQCEACDYEFESEVHLRPPAPIVTLDAA
jgi:hypothetical protein